jgi:hypothetical protein
MNKKLLEMLMKIEIAALVKKGVPAKDAVDQAADKLTKDMREAEFETYCSEHNC